MSDQPVGAKEAAQVAAALDSDLTLVRYRFSSPDCDDHFVVTGFEGREELNRPYLLAIDLTAENEATDTRELLGREASFTIGRGHHQHSFFGIIVAVTVHDNGETRETSTIDVVPALCSLRYSKTSRIFQGKSALEVVETVLGEELAPYEREIDTTSLVRDRYLARDYCVQYQETAFDFVHRLLEEEGIGYYFEHGGPERMILFDANRSLPRASTIDHGPVGFNPDARAWTGTEPVLRFASRVKLAPSTLRMRDHDWARSRPMIEGTATGEPAGARHEHEIYEHGFRRHVTIHEEAELLASLVQVLGAAAMPFGLPAGLDRMVHNLDGARLDGFTQNDIEQRAAIGQQLLHRDTRAMHGVSLVCGFSAGRTFDLVGHHTLGADGAYLITKVVHSSKVHDANFVDGPLRCLDGSNYHNRFECRPLEAPWRPERVTSKPRIYGVQTARVTGPMGMNVYTDQHGRIKVRFHWDRAGDDLAGNYTCWLRVSQTWAGDGAPGFVFIPRIGMEVVVSFVDGDPDRPLVTGCVYNAENTTPGLLPIQATKSIIRTRTVPHGIGYNELSFEDAMGMERVHVRAQRDLDELVLRDHETRVSRNQLNVVGLDQTEVIARDQRLTVRGDRSTTTVGTVTERARGRRVAVTGSDILHVTGQHNLTVTGSACVHVEQGEYVAKSKGRLALVQDDQRVIELSSEGDDRGIVLDSNGPTIHMSDDKIELKVEGSTITITAASVQINGKTFPASSGWDGQS